MKDFETMKPRPEETGGKHGERITKNKSKTPYLIGAVILIIITLILILSK